ncbi:Mechanosensitive ion channel-domain-containing protein [Catenaria anguillulae PL171]|uniref:Mechanosensitive ion channel-domain-containing protein n=1 Tax=Catenaria anguillulae PL171 TaxID=765915 RepID=A0A1Y2H6D5_9FUNG|nr:Mechanosensitive ion channel-domain-containing protein [Catenaria anguillulae PL171]
MNQKSTIAGGSPTGTSTGIASGSHTLTRRNGSDADPINTATATRSRRTNTRATRRSRKTSGARPAGAGADDIEVDDDDDEDNERDPHTRSRKEDFDWDVDHDDGSQHGDETGKGDKGGRRCAFIRNFLAKLPYWLQCLLTAILGDAVIFALLGLPDIMFGIKFFDDQNKLLSFPDWTSTLNIGGMPLLYWSIYLCISWTLHYVTLFALSIVPTILQRIFGIALGSRVEEKLSEYLNYFRVMHKRIATAVWIILSNVLWNVFVVVPNWRWKATLGADDGSTLWFHIIGKVLLTLFVIHTLWTGQKLILEVIATRFHRKAYKNRIRDSREANEFLERLLVSLRSPRPRIPMGVMSPSDGPRSLTSSFLNLHDDPTPAGSATYASDSTAKKQSKNVLNRAGQFIAKQANKTVAEIAKQAKLDPFALSNASSIPRSRADANRMARDLFNALVAPGHEELVVEDFRPYFDSDAEARRAFNVFDANRSGDISKDEMKSLLQGWMQEKRDIENSIKDVSSAVASLDYGLGAVNVFIMFIIGCNIWGLPTASYMSAIAAILLPGTFIFGGTLKTTFENVLYMFGQHYFDVGDTIRVDGAFYRVRGMSILTTILARGDGKLVFVPNAVLQTKTIDNIRRSGHMSEDVIIKVDIKTTQEQMDLVTEKMLDFLDENSRDFKPAFSWVIKEVLLSESALKCAVCIEHMANWQEMGKRGARRNAYLFALRQALLEAGVTCSSAGAPEYSDHL